jgi:cobalt-zinc-cadmium efflux system protein
VTNVPEHDHPDHDGHDHSHDRAHSHGAGHGHAHAPKDFGIAFAIGVALNLGFVVAEVVYGLLANSIALVADAGHNLGDVLGLVLAWIAIVLARRAPSKTLTYGLRRGTILSALANATLLLVTVGAIAVEGFRRLFEPSEVAGVTVMAVAAAGIVVNGVTAWLFASGRKDDINLRGAFMHMASDALVSLGVVIAGGVILLTGWTRLDPLVARAHAHRLLYMVNCLVRSAVERERQAVTSVERGETVTGSRLLVTLQCGINQLRWFHKPASSAFPRFPGFSPPRLSTSPGSRKSTACLQSIRRIRFISDPTNKSLTEVL